MSDNKIKYLLIYTSYLWKVEFDNPDFRKLLHHSKSDELKIFIPHIVWEERRTQLLEKAYAKMDKVRDAFEDLKALQANNIFVEGLPVPTLNVWSKAEIDARSREVMRAFATANKVEIVTLGPDHADRAWQRYFNIDPPFNRAEERKNRRKDIPDSWIFEAAIDLARKHPGMLALCDDVRLSSALRSIGVSVYNQAQQVLDEIDRSFFPVPEAKGAETPKAVPSSEKPTPGAADNKLAEMLTKAREPFTDLDVKILGYVSYLDGPTKDKLFGLLSQAGVSVDIAKNVAERLAITGIITDTGNHYLPGNKEAGDLAAISIETEIITLLE
jgi:hypothetical protein